MPKKLGLTLRTLRSLEYVDLMGDKIAHASTASENVTVLEQIRFATSVLDEVVQDHVIYVVKRMEGQYPVMQAGFNRWRIFLIF